MKCSELYRFLIKDGWYPVSQKGSHVKMRHDKKAGTILYSRITEVKRLVRALKRKFSRLPV